MNSTTAAQRLMPNNPHIPPHTTKIILSTDVLWDSPGITNPLITEIAAGFLSHKSEVAVDRLDWIYHNMACRAAIKGGDKSGAEDLAVLVRQVALSDDIRYCPHGRPVAYKLSRKELEKQFGRL